MNQHDHGKHHQEHHHPNKKRGLHKDWRLWVAVVLMLGAMAIYVLSDDEAIQPGGSNAPGELIDGAPVEAAP